MLARCVVPRRVALHVAAPVTQFRGYKSRLTKESFFEGHNLAKIVDATETSEPYVVSDPTPAPFKVKEGVKLLGFKYPKALAPDNKTFYAIAPRKPPTILVGVEGEYVEKLYLASMAENQLMFTEDLLNKFVLPLTTDPEIEKKFFSNTTVEVAEKVAAVTSFAAENKLTPIVTGLLIEVVQKDHAEYLPDIVAGYANLMKKIRCEATAEVSFGRVPTHNQVVRLRQLLSDLRSPTQYYVHSNFYVDPNLGGGVVIKMGDFEIDGSLNTRLAEVQKHLVKSLQA